jgi:hypothetical protein
MKTFTNILLVVLTLGAAGFFLRSRAADASSFQTFEYATIRWSGRENTHLIRPSGKVEPLGTLLMKAQRPDRTDERSFYMNIALNALAKEGYEFAGMTSDEIVMKRSIR